MSGQDQRPYAPDNQQGLHHGPGHKEVRKARSVCGVNHRKAEQQDTQQSGRLVKGEALSA